MKTVFAALGLLVCATNAMAVPEEKDFYISSAPQMAAANLDIADLKIVDDRFPGVTFTGTAKSIYEEMQALKPEAFADDVDIVKARSLGKRSTLNCNWSNDIQGWNSCNEGYNYLKRLGNSRCGVGPAPACARVSCSYRCGVYLCNKTSGDLWVFCGDIANDQKYIMDNCPHSALDVASGARDFDSHFIGVGSDSCS